MSKLETEKLREVTETINNTKYIEVEIVKELLAEREAEYREKLIESIRKLKALPHTHKKDCKSFDDCTKFNDYEHFNNHAIDKVLALIKNKEDSK